MRYSPWHQSRVSPAVLLRLPCTYTDASILPPSVLHANEIVASIMAHHANFYTDVLLFDKVSAHSKQSPKTNEQVRFSHLNLETMSERYAKHYSQLNGKKNLYRWFFQNKEESVMVDWLRLNRRPMTIDDLNYFGALKSDILAETKPETVAILMDYYRQGEKTVEE